MISTRNGAAEEEDEDEEDLDGDEKKKDKKKTKKKKKKPTSNDDHHHEESDEHELVDWEAADDHEIKHGHKHGQNTQDVLPVEEATGHEDANADKEVESGRSNGGGFARVGRTFSRLFSYSICLAATHRKRE